MSTEISQAPQSVSPPLWQRALSLLAPFCAGVMFLAGIEYAANSNMLWAGIDFVLSASMLILAWQWSK
jgi:hypothetical protein